MADESESSSKYIDNIDSDNSGSMDGVIMLTTVLISVVLLILFVLLMMFDLSELSKDRMYPTYDRRVSTSALYAVEDMPGKTHKPYNDPISREAMKESRDIEQMTPSRDVEQMEPSREIERMAPSRDVEQMEPSRDVDAFTSARAYREIGVTRLRNATESDVRTEQLHPKRVRPEDRSRAKFRSGGSAARERLMDVLGDSYPKSPDAHKPYMSDDRLEKHLNI